MQSTEVSSIGLPSKPSSTPSPGFRAPLPSQSLARQTCAAGTCKGVGARSLLGLLCP